MAASINAQDLKKRLTGVKPPSLIDVRRKTDYEADPNKIAGAIWRDPEKIEDWVKDLPLDAPAVVYCVRGGSVSRSAAHRLQQEGLNAVFLEGGLQAWTDGGQAVEAISAPRKIYTLASSDIDLLRRAGLSEDDIAHSLKVAGKALEIARRTGTDLDLELVGRGALFHDLGKARTHAMEHGRIGAEIGRELGLPEALTAIMEKHIRGGLTEAEAVELCLPVKDYTLHTLEERIIIYADRLVDIIMDGIVPIQAEQEAEDRFEEILRTYPKYGKNEITLNRYLGYHREIQGLIERCCPAKRSLHRKL
jgi:uncharacterized protein